MTYNVFSGSLNPTQSVNRSRLDVKCLLSVLRMHCVVVDNEIV